MVYDFLNRLFREGELKDKTIVFSDRSIITGGTVSDVNRSEIIYYGGESGHELLTRSIEKISEIRQNEALIYRRKRRIEKIYPRG